MAYCRLSKGEEGLEKVCIIRGSITLVSVEQNNLVLRNNVPEIGTQRAKFNFAGDLDLLHKTTLGIVRKG